MNTDWCKMISLYRVFMGMGHKIKVLVLVLLMVGCASPPAEEPESRTTPRLQRVGDFILVQAVEGDTFTNLAAKFLKDSSKAWVIAEFNDLTEVVPGNRVVIPLRPYPKGGLKATGYQSVPVLTYHRFSVNNPGKLTVTAEAFESQMKYLKENGYYFITLTQLIEFVDYKKALPPKAVAITVDDGWRSFYEIGFPILKRHGIPATLFVYTDFIGGSKAMTWQQVKTLANSGIDIQCHTQSHRDLTVLIENESLRDYLQAVEQEIKDSKAEIRQRLGKECLYLAYPYGKTNNLVINLLQKHGYQAGFTVDREANPFFSDKFRLSRSVIYGTYDMQRFQRNLTVFNPMVLK